MKLFTYDSSEFSYFQLANRAEIMLQNASVRNYTDRVNKLNVKDFYRDEMKQEDL